MKKIKPLSKPGFTMFNNYILDHIMPDLGGSAWKVLCVAIRKTIGWVDVDTNSGRKEQDRISYSQFIEGTGIKSSATISKAIQACLDKGYLIRWPSRNHPQMFDYGLNMDYEVEVEETTSETKEVLETTSDFEPVSGTTLEIELVSAQTSSDFEHTKESLKKEPKRKKALQSSFHITPEGIKVEH